MTLLSERSLGVLVNAALLRSPPAGQGTTFADLCDASSGLSDANSAMDAPSQCADRVNSPSFMLTVINLEVIAMLCGSK